MKCDCMVDLGVWEVVYQWEVRRTWEEQPTLQTEVADHQNCHGIVVMNSRLTADWFYNCLYFLFRPYTVPLLLAPGAEVNHPNCPTSISLAWVSTFCNTLILSMLMPDSFSSQHLETCRFNIL